MRKLNRAFLRVFLIAAPLAAGMGACSDSSDEEDKVLSISAQCTLNSDCNDRLVCAFGRCHAQCAEARDCPTGQRCVLGDAESSDDPGVCQLEDEKECSRKGDCQADQFCAQDGECRDGCGDDTDCVDGYTCTPSGVCAADEELDPDGDVPDAPPGGGSEGGAGGAAGGGAPNGEGGAGGADQATGGAGGDPGAELGEDNCGVQDVDNNDRDSATPYELGTEVRACLQQPEDLDFYEFTTPAEPAQGGWLVVRATDVGTDGYYYLNLYSGTDNALIRRHYGSPMGSNGAIWLPAAPGTLFRVSVEPYSVIPPDYTFSATFTGVEDPYEPNDERADATPIEVGDEIEAYSFNGHTISTAPEHDSDWYEIDLSAGSVRATLDQPEGASSYIYLYDSTGAQVTSKYAEPGVDATLERTGLPIGTYYFNVQHYATPWTLGSGTAPPETEILPYVFQVTQD